MISDPTLAGAFSWSIWFLGEVVFKWIPGAVLTIVGTGAGPAPAASLLYRPITEPVTAPEVIDYLQQVSAPGVYDAVFHYWSVFVALSILVSLVCAGFIIYCVVRLLQVRQLERRHFAARQRTVASLDIPQTQLRWNRVLQQAHSENEQNWRLAILEADIMLNELLDTLGYKGDTMADKMKEVDRVNFTTIDLAWEAHKVRNHIAHSGTAHELNSREVRRVMSLYQRVFHEFDFVK